MLSFILAHTSNLFGQHNVILSLSDSATGELIVNAEVLHNGLFLYTDSYGKAGLHSDEDFLAIVFHPSYQTKHISARITSDTLLILELAPVSTNLAEVTIKAKTIKYEPGHKVFSGDLKTKMPFLFSEADPIKFLQSLPGVSNVQEGNSGFYIRGGNSDQTLVLLDGAPIYNIQHAFGLFSIFNAQSIRSVELINSHISPELGGAGSGFLQVHSKNGDLNKYRAEVGIGTLVSSIHFEGPIAKEKLSFLIAGRKSYIGQLVKESDFKTEFSDLNLNLYFKPNSKNVVVFTAFYSKDDFKLEDAFGLSGLGDSLSWTNLVNTLRWSTIISKKYNLTNSISYSMMDQKSLNNEGALSGNAQVIRDFVLKTKLLTSKGHNKHMMFGNEFKLFTSKTQIYDVGAYNNFDIGSPSILNSTYFSYSKKWSSFKMVSGIRLNYFKNLSDNYQIFHPNPRISLIYSKREDVKFSFSYDLLSQFRYNISQTLFALPTDLWTTASQRLPALKTHSVDAGVTYKIAGWDLSWSLYYKVMQHMFDYKIGVSLFQTDDFTDALIDVKSQAYGSELFAYRETRYYDLYLSYTYSRSLRQSPLINSNNIYPSNYDRPHLLSVSFNYHKPKAKWQSHAMFTLQSGRSVTVPLYYNGAVTIYSDRNEVRLPVYHRFDIGMNYKKQLSKRYELNFDFSIYNVLNRRNTYQIIFDQYELKPYSLTLFPIIPSLAIKLKFN